MKKRDREKKVTLREFAKNRRTENFASRIRNFTTFLNNCIEERKCLYLRKVISPMDREVLVQSPFESTARKMLMFGSNNYLGLASHSYVQEKIQKMSMKHGSGVGGPPLLNGYTSLICELEQRLAKFKGKEDAIVFPSGYATNLGLFSSLPSMQDIVLVDEHHHASCFDGLKLGKIPHKIFPHNNLQALKKLLISQAVQKARDVFVAVEGVYSMRGDLAPLDDLVKLSEEFPFHLILDDAHGTGVLGKNGTGTADFFGVENEVEVIMGTFSKTFAVTGGFVTGCKEVINYLRYFARPYVFSGSLSPSQAAAVIAGLDLLEKGSLVETLWENIHYAKKKFHEIGIQAQGCSAIFTLPVRKQEIRELAYRFHERGVFVNAVEYPAVPRGQEFFRISLMARHTKSDIDRLVAAILQIWEG